MYAAFKEESTEDCSSETTVTRKLNRGITLVNLVDTALNVIGIDTPKSSVSDTQNDAFQEESKEKDTHVESVSSPFVKPETKATPNLTRKSTLKSLHKKHRSHHRRAQRSSDPYFIALFWLFAISRLWLHQWVFMLGGVLVIILTLKTGFIKLKIYEAIVSKSKDIAATVRSFYQERAEIILPGPVRGIMSIIHSGDQKVCIYPLVTVFYS